MKTAIFGTKKWEEEYLRLKLSKVTLELTFLDGTLSSESIPAETHFEILCVFVDSSLKRETLEKFQNLKMIATRSTGFDHIDLAYCKEKNITVSSVPSYGENTVAEFAFALILSLARKLYASVDSIRETGKYSFEGLIGFDLKGKTIGVVGVGRIGRHLIKMAKGFDMKVIGYDAFPNQETAKELGFEYRSFEDLLKESDVVSIHVPFMKETEKMFNEKTFALMKKGAILINTARGAVVETQALVKALQEGRLGGAGLDVLEEEGVLKDDMGFVLSGKVEGHDVRTIIANHVLIDMQNVLITPHTAFNTTEAIQRILDTTAENISGFLEGTPINIPK